MSANRGNANAELNAGRIVFVTGTDTGVGKTLLTALLLRHARTHGRAALAVKPFCSGSLHDVRILCDAQDNTLPAGVVNPFYFKEPVAPLVAARKAGRQVQLREVVAHVRHVAQKCELLLVEGAGGLFVPLGEGYTVADLIASLRCAVLIVSRNRLGTLNHTLLTLQALRTLNIAPIKIALMDEPKRGLVSQSNWELLREWAKPVQVVRIPFLGREPERKSALARHAKKLEKTLAQLLLIAIFSTTSTGSHEE